MEAKNKKRIYLSQFSIITENQFVLLPYSVATLWSYSKQFLKISENYELASDILFIKKPIEEVMDGITDPDVFGFSTYVWNSNYTDTLAKRVKEKYPDCLIVYGGPQVSDSDPDLFKKKPWVDICVHQEGEYSFKEILLQNLGDKDWSAIPGLSYNINQQRIATEKSTRIRNLDEIPSPYIEGIFDGYVEKYSDYTLNAILETNRGCPYKCTFCDWGGATFSKLFKFGEERVYEEIEWMGQNKIDCVVNADANFGIFKKRDSLIVDKLIESKEKFEYPKLYTTNWAKNNNELAVEMASRLKSAGMLRKFAIALQSLNENTLGNIERKNMKLNNFNHLVALARQHDITVMIELIMTLPGETYESWIKGYCELLEYDNLYIESYPCSLLANSEMNTAEYKKRHGLQTATVKLPFGDIIDEYEEMIVSTSTMSFEEASKAWIFTWMVRSFHSLGFLYYVANFLVREYRISYYDFYKAVEEGITNSSGVMKEIYDKQLEYIKEKQFSKFYISNWWVEAIGETKREEFYQEMKEIVKAKFDHELIDEVFLFQNIANYNPNKSYPVRQAFSYNFVEDEKSPCEIQFQHEGQGNHKSYKSFIALSRSARWKTKTTLLSDNPEATRESV